MSRNTFGGGSNLPPGVTQRMIEEQAGGDEPCECCGRHIDECVCPKCPRCGETGNPDCYEGKCTPHEPCPKCFEGECTNAPGMNCPPPRLRYSRDQRAGQVRTHIEELKGKILDEETYLAFLETQDEEWRDE